MKEKCCSRWYFFPKGGATKDADTFFAMPTTCWGESDCTECDEGMRQAANCERPVYRAAFGTTNVYSPYYPQLGLDHFMNIMNEGGWGAVMKAVDEGPLRSVIASFKEYLRCYNHGRPIILAGHSQGSLVLHELLLWIKNTCPQVLERIVASYLIGIPITQSYLDEVGLPFASGRSDTGVIISYNTMAPDAAGDPFAPPGTLTINPVSWTTGTEYAPKEMSRGSVIIDTDEHCNNPVCEKHFADAQIDPNRRGVITTAPVDPGVTWPVGVLHSFDMMLYACDIRKNIADRVCAYLEKQN